MDLLFAGQDHPLEFTYEALEQIRLNGDMSQVRVIVEMMRFIADPFALEEASNTLQQLTGRELGSPLWTDWSDWLGEHRGEFQPPAGYPQWKSVVLSVIDPRFAEFLATAEETARIDLVEVVWGGVRPDGIPDIQFPTTTSAAEADYLHADDRVFGVSINGEHRAYPLRIVNAHEMANDVVGGEQIALAY